MSNLTRWNPNRRMMSMSDVLDNLFDQAFIMPRDGGMTRPSIDVVENDNDVVVKAELPGYKPEDIDVRVEGNLLQLSGEFNEEKENKQEGQYHLRERRHGSFTRVIPLPTDVNVDKANADFDNGVLTLTLPKEESAKPKRISITAKSSPSNKK